MPLKHARPSTSRHHMTLFWTFGPAGVPRRRLTPQSRLEIRTHFSWWKILVTVSARSVRGMQGRGSSMGKDDLPDDGCTQWAGAPSETRGPDTLADARPVRSAALDYGQLPLKLHTPSRTVV